MSAANTDNSAPQGTPAKVAAEKPRIAAIWFVPIIAALIGAWLIFQAITSQGPEITIEFVSGEGIEAGKTHVKYKGIIVGEVESVAIKDDLSGVTVGVQMDKEAESALTEKTRFWIVKPRIAGGQISGLGTLLSGAYIGMDPVRDGKDAKKTRKYTGLERPPAVMTGEPGRAFKLRSPTLASLDFGSPIYYHGVVVGRVADYKMQDDGDLLFDIFIRDPHHTYIAKNTRFWNAGGVDLTLDAEGIRLQTASIGTLLAGGISFDTTKTMDDPEQVDEGHVFRLFHSERASISGEFTLKAYFVLRFDGSVRGLEAGAPVEFRGIRVGTVREIQIKRIDDKGQEAFRIPVLIAIEPERYGEIKDADFNESTNELIKRGMRASLQTGNLLTGKKYVDLSIYPDAEPAELDMSGRYPEIPTVGGSVEELVVSAQGLLKELGTTVKSVNALLATDDQGKPVGDLALTLRSLREVAGQVNTDMAPEMTAILANAEKVVADADSLLSADSTTRTELTRLLIDLAEAAKSLRALVEYLQQHPESIVFGKDE